MRLVGHLRAIEHDVDGLIHFVGPILETIQAGSRLIAMPVTRPTTTDAEYQLFASHGPPEIAPARHVWSGSRLPHRLGRLDGSDDD